MPLFREHCMVRRAWSALSSTSQRLFRETAFASSLLPCAAAATTTFALLPFDTDCHAEDRVRELQTKAIEEKRADFGHWGIDPGNYMQWGSHSNRLIPVYTFGTKGQGAGVDLDSYQGTNSPYRSEDAIRRLYGQVPTATLNPNANYLDQTNIYDLQLAAANAGKKYIFLVIFDGMDWQTTWAAATYAAGKVNYREGRGTGLFFQDYGANGTTQFGMMCTSPHNEGTDVDVDKQTVKNPGGEMRGGYNPAYGGEWGWELSPDLPYLISKSKSPDGQHAYTDSSSSASSMTAGLKTYNNCVNVDFEGKPVDTIAHQLQQRGWKVGAVSSVPISHATPAAAYAVNVHRDDYQDLTRDLLGLKSISHPDQPLPGLDVLIGGGYGTIVPKSTKQGENFVPGNNYLTEADLLAIDVRRGGKYVTAVRESGVDGSTALLDAAQQAKASGSRLFGFYGVGEFGGHLPFQTADGDYQPPPGRSKKAEEYSEADLYENPTLTEMTTAALTALESSPNGFWLMVEAGDVDWANHDNNIDNSIGAVRSGDDAISTIASWIETHSNWNESLMIVTADHGHLLVLTRPEDLVPAAARP